MQMVTKYVNFQVDNLNENAEAIIHTGWLLSHKCKHFCDNSIDHSALRFSQSKKGSRHAEEK